MILQYEIDKGNGRVRIDLNKCKVIEWEGSLIEIDGMVIQFADEDSAWKAYEGIVEEIDRINEEEWETEQHELMQGLDMSSAQGGGPN